MPRGGRGENLFYQPSIRRYLTEGLQEARLHTKNRSKGPRRYFQDPSSVNAPVFLECISILKRCSFLFIVY